MEYNYLSVIILLTIPFVKNIYVQLNEMVLPFQGQ